MQGDAMQDTTFYTAPDVNAEKIADRSKIWGVGCIVLEMWTGIRPQLGDVYQSKEPPLPEDLVLSKEANDFRRKCFAMCVRFA